MHGITILAAVAFVSASAISSSCSSGDTSISSGATDTYEADESAFIQHSALNQRTKSSKVAELVRQYTLGHFGRSSAANLKPKHHKKKKHQKSKGKRKSAAAPVMPSQCGTYLDIDNGGDTLCAYVRDGTFGVDDLVQALGDLCTAPEVERICNVGSASTGEDETEKTCAGSIENLEAESGEDVKEEMCGPVCIGGWLDHLTGRLKDKTGCEDEELKGMCECGEKNRNTRSQEDPKKEEVFKAVKGSTATDAWCEQNCKHNPPYCPSSMCTSSSPGKVGQAPEYILAKGGDSCSQACSNKGMSCDLKALSAVAQDLGTCKAKIESLGKFPKSGGTYGDDNSGCTYHPAQTGWYQVYRKNRDRGQGGEPTCEARNQDRSRQRLCACTQK